MSKLRALDLEAVSEKKSPLELPRRDPPMEKLPLLIVVLAALDEKLLFLNDDFDVLARKTGNRERDAQLFRTLRGRRDSLETRSSDRSISSKPSMNGEDNPF